MNGWIDGWMDKEEMDKKEKMDRKKKNGQMRKRWMQ